MRSMSACAPDHILKPGRWALRFIGSADRRLVNPECISPQIERQRARAARSAGTSPPFGFTSLRYSAIASVSQILMPLWVRQGTRIDGESNSNSARFAGSSAATTSSTKSRPAILHNSQPRSDQEELFLLLIVRKVSVIRLLLHSASLQPSCQHRSRSVTLNDLSELSGLFR